MLTTTVKSRIRLDGSTHTEDIAVWKSRVYELLPNVELRFQCHNDYVNVEIDIKGESKKDLKTLCKRYIEFIHRCPNLSVINVQYSLTDIFESGRGVTAQPTVKDEKEPEA